MTKLAIKIKRQLCLALILSGFAAGAYAAQVAPGPVCHVNARVLSTSAGKAIIKVMSENKVSDGFDKEWKCNFRKPPSVTINLLPDDFKKLSGGVSISAYLQQGGDENGLWVNAANVIVLSR